jgi:integrase
VDVAQQGSVYRRGDGYWVASIRLGNKKVVRYAKTEKDATLKLRDLIKDQHVGALAQPTKVTLDEWVAQWLAEATLRPSTVRSYRQVLTPVLNDVGSLRLDKLTPALLSSTYAKLAKQGMGARRRQLSHGYLKGCLERAVELEILGRNPMAKVRRPKWEPRQRRYWTAEQTTRFLQNCESDRGPWSPLFTVLTTCGLRFSEAIGLTWHDVDLEHKTLQVNRALVWVGGTRYPGEPKSKAGYREIALTRLAIAAFQRLERGDAEESIFVGPRSGHAPRPDALRKPLIKLCAQAGVPYVNIHGLRHVHAALALRATGDAHAVQKRLGHSHVTTTIGIYGYATHTDSDVAAAFDGLVGPRA